MPFLVDPNPASTIKHSGDEGKSARSGAYGGPGTGLWPYLRHARPAVILVAPFVYLCLIAFVILDLTLTLYQAICFPVFGIPKVSRRPYLLFDRGRLRYLNLLERVNCVYCSYANGLLSWTAEIAARTEQHWCPVKHSQDPAAPHGRYGRFLAYGDADAYRDRIAEIRRDFDGLR
jgi:hypothetical protein